MQNSTVRMSFGTWHSVKMVIGWEMHKILQQESLLVLVVVKLTKMRKKYLKFPRYLIWYKMYKFLSSVFYLHALPENLPGVLQKGSKFACFWAY